jgi:hypothetical protein
LKTYSAPELINIGTGEDLIARIDLASGNRHWLPYLASWHAHYPVRIASLGIGDDG